MEQWLPVLIALRGAAYAWTAWLTWRFSRHSDYTALCWAGVGRDGSMAVVSWAYALFRYYRVTTGWRILFELGACSTVCWIAAFLTWEVAKIAREPARR